MNQINQKALEELREIIELAPDTFVDAYKNGIEISLSLFASDIYISTEKETRISCPSSGYFTHENYAAYWRVIHTAECLRKWKEVPAWAQKWCNEAKKLHERALAANYQTQR